MMYWTKGKESLTTGTHVGLDTVYPYPLGVSPISSRSTINRSNSLPTRLSQICVIYAERSITTRCCMYSPCSTD